MTLAFHVLRKICRIKKTSLQFISTFGRNGTLSLEYLGPVAVFQQNINLRGAAQTSSPNIAHSAWMHESDARHTLKCDIYEFDRVKIDVLDTLRFSNDVHLLSIGNITGNAPES